jgi:hypothetical protein
LIDLSQFIDDLEQGALPEATNDLHALAQAVVDRKQDERIVDIKEWAERLAACICGEA